MAKLPMERREMNGSICVEVHISPHTVAYFELQRKLEHTQVFPEALTVHSLFLPAISPTEN